MQLRPLNADPNSMINLLDGTQVPYGDITFDTVSYHFTYHPTDGSPMVDITNTMTRADKLTFPSFDPVKDNNRLSYEAGRTQVVDKAGIAPTDELNTNVADLFAQNVGHQISDIASTGTKIVKYVAIGAGVLLLLSIINKRSK